MVWEREEVAGSNQDKDKIGLRKIKWLTMKMWIKKDKEKTGLRKK